MTLCKKEGNYLHLIYAIALAVCFYSLSIMTHLMKLFGFGLLRKNKESLVSF